MILTPKNNLGGNPLILGIPWLATTDAFISCRSDDMFIYDGSMRLSLLNRLRIILWRKSKI